MPREGLWRTCWSSGHPCNPHPSPGVDGLWYQLSSAHAPHPAQLLPRQCNGWCNLFSWHRVVLGLLYSLLLSLLGNSLKQSRCHVLSAAALFVTASQTFIRSHLVSPRGTGWSSKAWETGLKTSEMSSHFRRCSVSPIKDVIFALCCDFRELLYQ